MTTADGSHYVPGLPAGTDYQVCFDGSLLDPVARDVALAQLAGCDPVIAADTALHARRWFVEQVDRTLRLIRAAGGLETGRDEIALVAALLEAATRREPAPR